MWGEHIPTWESGEDIGFSATAWLKAGIRTVMPAMPLTAYEVLSFVDLCASAN